MIGTESAGMEARNYRFAMLRESSRTVINFVCSLELLQLQQFWLSRVYSGHSKGIVKANL